MTPLYIAFGACLCCFILGILVGMWIARPPAPRWGYVTPRDATEEDEPLLRIVYEVVEAHKTHQGDEALQGGYLEDEG